MESRVEKNKKLFPADHCIISCATIGENQQQLSSSFETALGEQQRKMNNRILRKIWICSDVLVDIFPFFDRPQLGLKLALISPRFDVLVEKYFEGKSELTIWRPIYIQKGIDAEKPIFYVCDGLMPFPLPERSLPTKICFKCLEINYIDHSVIEFLLANPLVFGKFTQFSMDITSSKIDVTPIWDVFVRQIWPIFGPNIRHLDISPRGVHLDNFVRLITPTIFSDLARLNSIQSWVMFPDLVADDGPTATSSAGHVLSQWLHKPTTDGQPKRLRCLNHCLFASAGRNFAWINNFKEVFLRATTSVNYHINFAFVPSAVSNVSQPNEQFELVNERTKEKLTMHKKYDFGNICWWIMERCPIIGETAAVQQQKDEHLHSILHIVLDAGDNNCIWPLYPSVKLSGSE